MKRWFVLISVLASLVHMALAQQRQTAEGEILRINTALVTLSVDVTDKQGRTLTRLQQEDFAIYEDGQLQEINFFGAEDQPISFGLLLDRSQSMNDAGKLANAIEAALAFLRAGNSQNEAFCLAFNESLSLLADFTSDYAKIGNSFNGLEGKGGTSLYDAILAGLDKLATAKHRRRVLIVITDGRDEHSQHKLNDLLKRAQQAEAQIYTVGFYSPIEAEIYRGETSHITLMDGTQVDNPRIVFQQLAAETGAETFFPKTAAEMTRTMTSIATNLRRMYLLAYYPSRLERDDRYRRLEVKVRNVASSQIKTRRGYRLTDAPESVAAASSIPEPNRVAARESLVLTLTPRVSAPIIPPLYHERFDQPNNQWPQTEKSYTSKGKYYVHGEAVIPLPPFRYQNFELMVNATQLSAPISRGIGVTELATIGLSFRINPNGYYEISLAPIPDKRLGIFTLSKVVSGRRITLWHSEKEPVIDLNNQIKVRCRGAQIEIFINGLRIAKLKDDAHATGTISLLFNGKAATFDDITIKQLE